MSIAYEVLKYLETKNIGQENVDLFVGFEPENPINCITFFDEQATTPPETSCLAVDMFGMQVIVRNSNYFTCSQKIKEINKKIVGFGGRSLIDGGDIVSYITVETAPFSLGKDSKGNNQWSAHYNIRVKSELDDFRL